MGLEALLSSRMALGFFSSPAAFGMETVQTKLLTYLQETQNKEGPTFSHINPFWYFYD